MVYKYRYEFVPAPKYQMWLGFVAPGMVGEKKKESWSAFCTSYLETKQTPIEENSTSNGLGLVSGSGVLTLILRFELIVLIPLRGYNR